jgi:hypothetical protein
MQNMQSLLFKLGIPTYMYTVETAITGEISTNIGETLPQDLGWIYGLSTNVNGVTARDKTKIYPTALEASNLFLNLKYGQAIFVNGLRLSDLIFLDPLALAQPGNSERYLQVNIPLNTDLKLSYIQNPTQIGTPAAPVTTALNLFYIDIKSYTTLVKQKMVLQNGMAAGSNLMGDL